MNKSVTQILETKISIHAKPGQKIECPFCGKKTFFIKSDDTLGKCFHSQCGKFINSNNNKEVLWTNYFKTMEKLFHQFHTELLYQKDQDGRNAYTYLVRDRKIHPKIIRESMLGVIPKDFDINATFNSLILEARELIDYEKENRKGKPGRPSKEEGNKGKEHLQLLEEAKNKLKNCTDGNEGWLCFFYTDSNHNIVSIKFREPYTKNIRYFKPFQNCAGVFGLSLFNREKPAFKELGKDHLLITEGEFNQLQLQSLYLKATANNSDYLTVCAVGGVNNVDLHTIQSINPNPIVCYDNDESNAGFQLVEYFQERMSITVFTTPETNSDLDDFILSFEKKYTEAWKAVQDLICDRKTHERSFQGIASEIEYIRNGGGKFFEINKQVSQVIYIDLYDRGNFYRNGEIAYYFLSSEKILIAINPDNFNYWRLIGKYGILPADKLLYQYITESLYLKTLEYGQETEMHRLSYYNCSSNTLYLFNGENLIYRIDTEKIKVVDNGTDGVLFLKDRDSELLSVEIDRSSEGQFSLLDRYILSIINFENEHLSPTEQRLLFLLWFYSLFFESLLPTKPILTFIGPRGSGKSMSQRMIGRLIFGRNFNVSMITSDIKDFDAAVTNSAYVVLDNIDSYFKWLEDRLAIVATGGNLKRRELYTTNKLIDIPVKCFLAINSRNPHFRREDVADRLLIFQLKRIASGNFCSEKKFIDDLDNDRSLLMKEVICHLQEIVHALKETSDEEISGSFRLADFYEFAIRIAKYAGIESTVKRIFEKLSRAQTIFSMEKDAIMMLLPDWVRNNTEREVTAAELREELSELAKEAGIHFNFQNNKAFAQNLNNLRPSLEQYIEFQTRTGGGNRTYYSFKLKP